MFQDIKLLDILRRSFMLDWNGDHGIAHWANVYENCLMLADHYHLQSDVFGLFALLHDSQRIDEFYDEAHGMRAAVFAHKLLKSGVIDLSREDAKRLIFACANHTKGNVKSHLINDMVVQICMDSDRLDIGRVGIVPDPSYMQTHYAKQLASQSIIP